jgi:hypothetical protein
VVAVFWRTARVLVLLVPGFIASPAVAGETTARQPIAEVLGRTVYADELTAPATAGGSAQDAAALERARGEKLRRLVWTAIFDDYSRQRSIEPTAAEIESHLREHLRFKHEDKIRREKQREQLANELKSPSLTEARRKQAQQHLETLDRIEEHESRITRGAPRP